MTSRFDNQSCHRSGIDALHSATASATSAQVIGLKVYPGGRRFTNAPTEAERLLTVFRAEIEIANGISRGLVETMARFQDDLARLESQVERDDAEFPAAVLKRAVQLRAAIRAASNDLQCVCPDTIERTSDVPWSDLVYS